jgi:hypothetical protein
MNFVAALLLALQAPDPAELARTSAETHLKFSSSAASWTMRFELESGAVVEVATLWGRGVRRLVLSARGPQGASELCRIIERGDFWYRLEGNAAGKYRPYEAPMRLPTAHLFLTRADVRMASREFIQSLTFESIADGIATYRMPMPRALREQLESTLKEAEAAGKEIPGADRARELIKKGQAVRIELATGLIVQAGTPKLRQTLVGFRWLDKVDDAEFAVDGRAWEDHTGDPTAGNRDELILAGHNGFWQPGGATGDTELRLVNLENGEIRRVPYAGSNAMPGCFTRDRGKVIVSGLTEEGSLLPFEINLKTGANRRLGGKGIESGFALFPAISPDGKQVVLLHKDQTTAVLESHVTVIDLASGESRRIGKPMDTAFVSWPADGKGLLLIRRTFVAMDKPSKATICRMDLDGKLTDVRPGDQPLLLDGARMLFRDAETDEWKTSDLEGKAEALFAEGARGFMQPAVSPDGKRVMMVKARAGREPWLMIFAPGEKEPRRAFESDGLWIYPAWR